MSLDVICLPVFQIYTACGNIRFFEASTARYLLFFEQFNSRKGLN